MRLYLSRNEQYTVAILLLAILGALLVLSYAYGSKTRARDEQAPLVQQSVPPSLRPVAGSPSAYNAPIVVEVAGAVKKPGVYGFTAGARMDDAIRQAGGPTADGCLDAFNRAQPLEDGWQINVPTRAQWRAMQAPEQSPPPIVRGSRSPAAITASAPSAAAPTPAATHTGNRGNKSLPQGKISINTAGRDELMSLPGIGPVMAQSIIDYRNAHNGKFTDLAELLNVPRIGPKTLERLTPYITL